MPALADFFATVVTDEDWFDDEAGAIAQHFQDQQAAIAALENVQVFNVEHVEIDAYIVGAISLDISGFKLPLLQPTALCS